MPRINRFNGLSIDKQQCVWSQWLWTGEETTAPVEISTVIPTAVAQEATTVQAQATTGLNIDYILNSLIDLFFSFQIVSNKQTFVTGILLDVRL